MADATLDDLIAEVALNESVEDSALALIDDLVARLEAIPPVADPNILKGIIDGLRAHREPLAAAILANTPGADRVTRPAHLDPAAEGATPDPGAPPTRVVDPAVPEL